MEPDRDWVARARELAARFAERAAAHDREGSFPFENFAELRAAGFYGLTVPARYGGAEASLATYLGVLEALARGDGSTALAFMMHLKTFGQEREAPSYPEVWFERFCRGAVERGELVNTVATEEGLGSPSGGGLPDTVARREGGGWVLEGRKTFTTLAPVLHHFIVLARVEDGGSGPRAGGELPGAAGRTGPAGGGDVGCAGDAGDGEPRRGAGGRAAAG
ncbi:acyl-CoA/acyl-ACP dehydrogenase [Tepidiforma flava]|uniref:Acyl-CoA/acyl-ACP dehydrogenase n=1 Tax=Tepidiforma flava TaxID=3004094 RepID=A0ABY7M3T6_9CHLR|nr:acyl-CoA dehydrogenase family protein [Tepidiforma flava]WBL35228.1 acyl-CoA/acyl-ACP dehydrogenase [Tepidiforma flava]